ncbi:hypothetical protein [Propionimicrobium sp. PCR01-08-3]|uniref:hypothetical protein n=1 Tax=Propionimicrobium sp. PCR01-08-3 TaxID=3052086 RepID=UPI00255C86C5|nr:hypothetical protein [Propionimicrobium sp. PCR01-08-3]WIY83370.1 hypothetical protein QQ658_03150 [Propionimicrobium sp. PCR01-08-3]
MHPLTSGPSEGFQREIAAALDAIEAELISPTRPKDLPRKQLDAPLTAADCDQLIGLFGVFSLLNQSVGVTDDGRIKQLKGPRKRKRSPTDVEVAYSMWSSYFSAPTLYAQVIPAQLLLAYCRVAITMEVATNARARQMSTTDVIAHLRETASHTAIYQSAPEFVRLASVYSAFPIND